MNSTQRPATCTVSACAGTTPIRSTSHQPDLLPGPAASGTTAIAWALAAASEWLLAKAGRSRLRPRKAGPRWRWQRRQLNCRESRERASTRPLLTPGAGEIAQSGPHHPTRPERLADPERRATRGSSHVAVRGGARCLRSHQARPSRTALLLRKGYMDVCTMQQQAVRTQHTSTGGMRMRMHRRQAVGGKRRQ